MKKIYNNINNNAYGDIINNLSCVCVYIRCLNAIRTRGSHEPLCFKHYPTQSEKFMRLFSFFNFVFVAPLFGKLVSSFS